MRCDMCPLCPIAEDDVCPIAESEEWGIEHKDGMMGCRHPYNWCKKKGDEYAEYLGRMGEGMAREMELEHRGFVDGWNRAIDRMIDIVITGIPSDMDDFIRQLEQMKESQIKEQE